MTGEPTRRGVLAALGAGAAGVAGCITLPGESNEPAGESPLELAGVWPSFGVDARNTGRAETTAPSDPVVDWEFDTTGPIYDGVAVADGTVYVGSTDGTLYAVDAGSGEERWRFPVRGQVRTTPAVSGDLVFVGGGNGGLYAVEADSGDQRWEALPRVEFSLSHPTVADGVVYAGGGDGRLYAVDAGSGEERWNADVGGEVASSPAVADGAVYVGWRAEMESPDDQGEGGLTALDADGEELWSDTRGAFDGSPAVADGMIYAGSGSAVIALDADGGDEVWSFETEGSTGAPSVADGTVYVGSHDTNLYALEADSGDEAWRFETVKWANYAPAVADGTVVLPSWDTRVYGVDADSGEKTWSVSLETPLSDPAVADGTAYVATENTLVALRDE